MSAQNITQFVCYLCDEETALDSVTFPDYTTGELIMVHEKCLDETGVTQRLKEVEEMKKKLNSRPRHNKIEKNTNDP